MTESNTRTLARSLHDVGWGAWFGGSLMGAIGLNGAAATLGGGRRTAEVASAGWARWAPVCALGIGAHLYGASAIAAGERQRVAAQQGVLASTMAKTVVTGAALAVTIYARVLGRKIEMATSPDPDEAELAEQHPSAVDRAQRQLRTVQWMVPVLTGALGVLNALHGEQQRPAEQARGFARKMMSMSGGPAPLRSAGVAGMAGLAGKGGRSSSGDHPLKAMMSAGRGNGRHSGGHMPSLAAAKAAMPSMPSMPSMSLPSMPSMPSMASLTHRHDSGPSHMMQRRLGGSGGSCCRP